MFRFDYHGASARDICAAASAPQGYFINHFRSKEAFPQEVLDRYFADTKTVVNEALNDKLLTPRHRLKRYLDIISERLEGAKWLRWILDCGKIPEAERNRVTILALLDEKNTTVKELKVFSKMDFPGKHTYLREDSNGCDREAPRANCRLF